MAGFDKGDCMSELESFKSDVSRQFDGVRNDLKELTKAMRELIRLEGDIKRTSDALIRIGRQVDDHDERIRALETSDASERVRVSHSERFIWLIISLGTGFIGSVLTMLMKG